MNSDTHEYIRDSELHRIALEMLPEKFTAYRSLRAPIEEATGYEHPYNILDGLVQAGLAERRIYVIYGHCEQPRGSHTQFRRLPA